MTGEDESIFAFNPSAKLGSVRVGCTPIAVSVADEVLRHPQQVIQFGLGHELIEDPSNLYPGVRAQLPAEFSRQFADWLEGTIQSTGMLGRRGTIHKDASFFSIVNKSPASLLPLQRIPHYDSADPSVFAAVIYLFDRPRAGTSFYRHRATGYERIGEETEQNYRIALNHNMKTSGPPPREYSNGSNALFERIHSVDSVFNRIVIYPGNVLHAADIDGGLIDKNASSHWRVTITSLISCISAGDGRNSGTKDYG